MKTNKPSFSGSVSWRQPSEVLGLLSAGGEVEPVHGNLLPFHPAGDFLPVGMQKAEAIAM